MRIFFCFIVLITAAIPGLTQVGTKQEAIQAAMDGAEPSYIKTLMEKLSLKIDRVASTKPIETATEKLAFLSIMQGIVERTQNYAIRAASEGAWYFSAQEDAQSAANNAALERARLRIEKGVWSIAMKVQPMSNTSTPVLLLDAAKNASIDAALSLSSRDQIGRITYRVVEWETLNWLLDNFETEIEKIGRVGEMIAREHRGENPFKSQKYLIEFYSEQFEILGDNEIQFLAPWLIHLVPPDLAGRHEALFFDLNISNANARGR